MKILSRVSIFPSTPGGSQRAGGVVEKFRLDDESLPRL